MPTIAETAVQYASRAQLDPGWWIQNVLGSPLWEKQIEIAESVRDFERTAVRSCHGIGKSYIAARIAIWFLQTHKNSIVVTTAPTYRQVAKITWQELRSAHKASRIQLPGSLLETECKVADKWFAIGFTATDPDHFQGVHADHVLIILEEAAGILSDIWLAVDGCLTGAHCRLLSIGNPTDGSGDFAKEFRSPGVNKIRVDAFSTPNFQGKGIVIPGLITPAWVEDKRKRWGEDSPMYQSRVMAEFPTLGDRCVFPLGLLERAVAYEAEHASYINQLGVDVARFGVDETIFMHRLGQKLRLQLATSKQSTMETVGNIIRMCDELGVHSVRIDDTGVGGGVTDRLRELKAEGRLSNVKVHAINNGSAPSDKDHYINTRAQLAWCLRTSLEAREVDLDADEDLQAQLSNVQYKITSQGKIQLESKEESKRKGQPSPDRADAAVLAWAPEAVINLVSSNAQGVECW